jgi:hypothetical protein
MNLNAFFSDRRRRNLALLAAAALLGVVASLVALDRRAAVVAPKYPAETFFPGLAHQINEVTNIRVVSKKGGAFDVHFVPNKGWVLPGRANYPASFEEVRKTLVGLAALETIEPKTDRPGWFHYVDLDAPPKGGGLKITLTDDKGRVLAELIAGKSEDIGDAGGAVGLFVRKPGENQSWLVRSPVELRAGQADWMDRQVMDVDRLRVREADVKPASGPSFKVGREKPTDAAFTLTPMPKGRELSYPGAADSIASAIAGFSFDDIKPAGEIDFTAGVSRMVTKTFDGLIVTTEVVKAGEDIWVRVVADAEPGKTEAAKQARDINARANGWAFKLEAYKGAVFASTLESLLKPKK